MKAFLQELAEQVYQTYGNSMSDLCLVFPGRRAGLYFKKYLSEITDKPVWSPTILTIRELFLKFSELKIAEDIELISILYKVYRDHTQTRESLDEFYFWGEMMLADFDDIDKYLVDAADLFANLTSMKRIENTFDYLTEQQIHVIQRFWKAFSDRGESNHKKQFLEIWNILYPVYQSFREKLAGLDIAYEGMIYREVIQQFQQGSNPRLSYEKVLFAGFNALNPCEAELFRYLSGAKRADFFWDFDDYYVENPVHEAGRFIRKFSKDFPASDPGISHSSMAGDQKNISVVSVSSVSGQAKVLSGLLRKILAEGEASLDDTAIVLGDESLLIPVLQSLPEEIIDINVTMGYPISGTPVFSLVEQLINLQKSMRATPPGTRFYHTEVMAILQHQYIRLKVQKDADRLIRMIQKGSRIFVPKDDLQTNHLFEKIFQAVEKHEDIPDYLMGIIEVLAGAGEEESGWIPPLEMEFIYHIYIHINKLKDLFATQEVAMGIKTFLKLFQKLIRKIKLPFSGEPLSGIQVMGILETRCLDFRNIIILSMNEGIFPSNTIRNSFIPYFLRQGFSLPVIEYQDAIYSYYFYRLLQRAGNISLIYNNQADGLRTGERSRFIYQLQFDPGFTVSEQTVGFKLKAGRPQSIIIPKQKQIMDQLGVYMEGNPSGKTLSPSALNTYIDCSLKFYFRYIAGLEEPEKIRQEIDPAIFGSLLHEIVQAIYKRFPAVINVSDLSKILEDEPLIRKVIEEACDPDSNLMEGRNVVTREVMLSYVKGILAVDMKYAPFSVVSLEEKYSAGIGISLPEGETAISIGGIIDRIDQKEGRTRIIDYKTGSSSLDFKEIKQLFDREDPNRNKAAFQTFLYALVYAGSAGENRRPLVPGLYIIRNIYSPGFDYRFVIGERTGKSAVDEFNDYREVFLSELKLVLAGLFDSRIPFSQTPNTETCKYCDYKNICLRQ